MKQCLCVGVFQTTTGPQGGPGAHGAQQQPNSIVPEQTSRASVTSPPLVLRDELGAAANGRASAVGGNAAVSSNPFFGDLFGSQPSLSGTRGMNFLLHQYRSVADTTHLPFHFLLLIFVEALHHMGWCEFNPFVGFALPVSASGAATKSGFMPHWCQSFTSFSTCWAAFMTQLEAKGGDKAMRDGMQGLQAVVTGMMAANVNDTAQWLVTAHVIMQRVHTLCVDLDSAALGKPLTLAEERTAGIRAAKAAPSKASTPSQPGPSNGQGSGASQQGQGNNNNRRRLRPQQQDSWQRNGRPRNFVIGARVVGSDCPYHPQQGHTVFQCDHFTRLQRQHQASHAKQGQ